MNRIVITFTAIVVLADAHPARSQVICTWNGSTGNWLSPALWSPAVPNNGTPAGATYNATVNGSGTISVDQSVSIQTLNFPSGNIHVLNNGTLQMVGAISGQGAGAFAVDAGGTLQFASGHNFQTGSSLTGGGTARFLGASQFNTGYITHGFTFSGTIEANQCFLNSFDPVTTNNLILNSASVSNTVTVLGSMTSTNGGLAGAHVTVYGGATINSLDFGGGGSAGGGNLTLAGGVSTLSGGMGIPPGSYCSIASGATLNAVGGAVIDNVGFPHGGAVVLNDGTFRKQSGTGNINVRRFDNTGSLEVLSGSMTGQTGIETDPGISGAGNVSVAAGAAIGGKFSSRGTVRGGGTLGVGSANVIGIGGTLAPGDGVGIMNAVTLVQMSSGSRIAVELNGNTAGTQYDQLNLGTAGSISLNGNAALVPILGYAPAVGPGGDALTILSGTGTSTQIIGTFVDQPNGSVVDLGFFDGVHYSATITYSAHSVVLHDFLVPVPEPNSLALTDVATITGVHWLRRRSVTLRAA